MEKTTKLASVFAVEKSANKSQMFSATAHRQEGLFWLELVPKGRPKGLFFLFNGFPGWKSKNYDVAECLCIKGFVVVIPHYRGLGQSLGHFGFMRCLNEMELFVRQIREKYPNLPSSAFGHSWGGMVAASVSELINRQVIFWSPFVIFPTTFRLKQIAIGLFDEARRDLPRYTLQKLMDEFERLRRLEIPKSLATNRSKLSTTILHGSADTVLDVKESKALTQLLGGGRSHTFKLLKENHDFNINRYEVLRATIEVVRN